MIIRSTHLLSTHQIRCNWGKKLIKSQLYHWYICYLGHLLVIQDSCSASLHRLRYPPSLSCLMLWNGWISRSEYQWSYWWKFSILSVSNAIKFLSVLILVCFVYGGINLSLILLGWLWFLLLILVINILFVFYKRYLVYGYMLILNSDSSSN